MKDSTRLKSHISRMTKYANLAVISVQEIDYVSFLDDTMKQFAIGRCLEIIGRAADRIIIDYPDFVDGQKHIPWFEIRKMNHHRMFDKGGNPVLDRIWSTVENDIPHLLESLERIPDEDLQQAKRRKKPEGPFWKGQLKPSQVIESNREVIHRLVIKHHMANPRVFGSVAKETDTYASDLDIVVDRCPGGYFFGLIDLKEDLKKVLEIKVDVLATDSLSEHMRKEISETAYEIQER